MDMSYRYDPYISFTMPPGMPQKLQPIIDEIITPELKSLQFLLRDIVPLSKLENIPSIQLFEIICGLEVLMEDVGELGNGAAGDARQTEWSMPLLGELLHIIGRDDLLHHICLNVQQVDQKMKDDPEIFPYRRLLFDLGQELLKEDIDKLKFLLSDVLSKSSLDSCETAMDLFVLLEKKYTLSQKNFTLLMQLLNSAKKHSLVTKIEKFIVSIQNQPLQQQPGHRQRVRQLQQHQQEQKQDTVGDGMRELFVSSINQGNRVSDTNNSRASCDEVDAQPAVKTQATVSTTAVRKKPVINNTVLRCQLLYNDTDPPIGCGGYGVVFKAFHQDWGSAVAYKELSQAASVQKRYIDGLMNEAEIHRQLRHENIVSLLGVVSENGHYGLVLEYIHYGSLHEFLLELRELTGSPFKVSIKLKTRMSYEVCCGMSYLHTQTPNPVIHGDLKMRNLLVGETLRIKISDFGLSKWKDYYRTFTQSGILCGTSSHIPPEHFLSKNKKLPKNEKYDVYSFSILLWEMFTEEIAFEDQEDVLMQLVINDVRPLLEQPPQVMPSYVASNIKRCWQKEPHQRPTFRELLFEFKTFIQDPDEVYVKAGKDILEVYSQSKRAQGSISTRSYTTHRSDDHRKMKQMSRQPSDAIDGHDAESVVWQVSGVPTVDSQQPERVQISGIEHKLDTVSLQIGDLIQKTDVLLTHVRTTTNTMPEKYGEMPAVNTKHSDITEQSQSGLSVEQISQTMSVLPDLTNLPAGEKVIWEAPFKPVTNSTISNSSRADSNVERIPPLSEHGRKMKRASQILGDFLRRTDGILEHLLENRALTSHEWDEIRFQSTTYSLTQRLIDVLSGKTEEAYRSFLQALDVTNQNYLSRLLEEGVDVNYHHKEVLIDNFTFLNANLNISHSYLPEYLLQYDVLDNREVNEIRSCVTEHLKVQQLLGYIMRISEDQYKSFLIALSKSGQQFIVDNLESAF